MEILIEDRILIGLFLCSDKPNEILKELKPEWNEKVESDLMGKYSMINIQQSIFSVFPWKEELSEGIDHKKFCESFFIQPDLFLRLRPAKEKIVKEKLKEAGIQFEIISDNCLALPNSSKIDNVIELNKEAVVQDRTSQRVGAFFSLVRPGQPVPILRESDRVWDCCTASGGKSIMLYDLYPNIDLTVSDIRESILINLKKRFREAGITKYKSLIVDLTASNFIPHAPDFDLIIADAPCTGSGTWSRTPEQLYYFKKEKIDEYASLQKKIVSNAVRDLKPGGHLLYITCSVFKKENEEVVAFIEKEIHLQLIKMDILKGYDKKADTLFAALLRKPL